MNHILITEGNRKDFSGVLPKQLPGQQRTTIGAYEDDGTVTGAVSVQRSLDHCDMDWIYVMPEARRRGIGSGLVAAVSDFSENTGGLGVSCVFAAEEEEALYPFFVSEPLTGLLFDVTYAYDEFTVGPKELEAMVKKIKLAKKDDSESFFDLPTYLQREALELISDQYEVSDFYAWSQSCEKKLCRVIYFVKEDYGKALAKYRGVKSA